MDKELIQVNLKCNKCGHEWEYNGTNPYYATCPYCYAKVKVKP